MGKIIHSKILPDNKFIYKLLIEPEELANLKGNLRNIYLFCADLCNKNAEINQRGNKGVTKYFKIPLSIRSRKKYYGTLSYQKIETDTKVFYVYIVDKNNSGQLNNKDK